MGSVFKAEDPSIGRIVAIKTISMDQIDVPSVRREFKKRFFQEAKICGKMTHPGILAIHDIGEQDEMPFIATEYIEGTTLSRHVSENPLSGSEICDILGQVARALDYAHECGIIHRDVKPQNIMINLQGRTKVLDFGLAKLAEAEMTHLTRPGDFIGSPSYSSPEQVKGMAIDSRSDIFSFGVTAYELITGKRPFRGESINAVLFKIISGEAAAISLPDFPPEGQLVLNQIFKKALHKDPDRRFQKCEALVQALKDVLENGDFSKNYAVELGDDSTIGLTIGLGDNSLVNESGKLQTQWHHPSQPESTQATKAEPRAGRRAEQKKEGLNPLAVGGAMFLLIAVAFLAWRFGVSSKKISQPVAVSEVDLDPGPEAELNPGTSFIENAPSESSTSSPFPGDSEDDVNSGSGSLRPEPEPELPKDVSKPKVETAAPVIPLLFPDKAFKDYLVSAFDQNGDGEVSRKEALEVTSIKTPGKSDGRGSIRDLTGIGYFSNLKTLDCSYENLVSLPVLPEGLEMIDVSGNKLTALVAMPQSLKALICAGNRLVVLDPLPAGLARLDCSSNKLAKLPQLPEKLTVLDCSGNLLTQTPQIPASIIDMDISGNDLSAEDCPDLTALNVQKLRYSPQRGGDSFDCKELARELADKNRKLEQARARLNKVLNSKNLEASRKQYDEVAALSEDTGKELIGLMALEFDNLLDNWRPGFTMSSKDLERIYKAGEGVDPASWFCNGFLFEKGIGCRKNGFEAKKWYDKAAALDFPPAIHHLGFLYREGSGVVQSHEKAAEYFFKAAELGYVPSKYRIGEMYRTGNGLDPLPEEAFRWMSDAAEADYAPAQASLAYMYTENIGVTGSRKERKQLAIYWYCRAATQGNGQGKMGLRELKSELEDCSSIIKSRPEK